MIEVKDNTLVFSFPEVHERATCSMSFRRNLYFPEKHRSYKLPPSLGNFSLHRVEDYADRLPRRWGVQGGFFLPRYRSETLWISFSCGSGAYPMAVKVASRDVDALTGKPFRTALTGRRQDYLLAPLQPWLDSFCVEEGVTRQFAAKRPGAGPGSEDQLTADSQPGALQIVVYPMKSARYGMLGAEWFDIQDLGGDWYTGLVGGDGLVPEDPMDYGAYYEDLHGIDAWEHDAGLRCFVHVLNSAQYRTVTGCAPPQDPPDADLYRGCGLPWQERWLSNRRPPNEAWRTG